MKPADAIVDDVLDVLCAEVSTRSGRGYALLVNGLGATPLMELSIVMRHALANLSKRGLAVTRAWCGNFMTALEMPGMSLTLLPLDDNRIALLDRPVTVLGWQGSGSVKADITVLPGPAAAPAAASASAGAAPSKVLRRVAFTVAERLTAAEAELGDLDGKVGDGDLGASMSRGAAAIRALPSSDFAGPETMLTGLGHAVRRAIAGSSGPFYATALLRAGSRLRGIQNPTDEDWRDAFQMAITAISDLGGARRGDRTMLDAMIPALNAWHEASAGGLAPADAFARAAQAALIGAEETAELVGRVGRSSYLGERAIGTPDGGAVAVSIWMRAIADNLK